VSHPSDDELVDLALGETADAERSAHVAGCARCSASVEQLRRTARLVSGTRTYAGWQAPDDAVWGRVAAEIDAEDEVGSDVETDVGTNLDTDLDTDAGADAETGAPPGLRPGNVTRIDRPTRRRTAMWAAGLVAASLVVGLLAGRAIWGTGQPGQPAQVAQVALSTLDTRQREGEATLVRAADGLDLRVATTRPLDAGDGYLEVWLLNADGKRMVSVGVLQQGESGTFPVTQALIDQGYVIVDISKEQFDDKPAHSGDSLLRGRLSA
jgi:hypothetical protein